MKHKQQSCECMDADDLDCTCIDCGCYHYAGAEGGCNRYMDYECNTVPQNNKDNHHKHHNKSKKLK